MQRASANRSEHDLEPKSLKKRKVTENDEFGVLEDLWATPKTPAPVETALNQVTGETVVVRNKAHKLYKDGFSKRDMP